MFAYVRVVTQTRGDCGVSVSENYRDEGEFAMSKLLRCPKRLCESIRFWHKQGGRRGYLSYVGEFVRMRAVAVAFDSTFKAQSGACPTNRHVDVGRLARQAPIDLVLAGRAKGGRRAPGPTLWDHTERRVSLRSTRHQRWLLRTKLGTKVIT